MKRSEVPNFHFEHSLYFLLVILYSSASCTNFAFPLFLTSRKRQNGSSNLYDDQLYCFTRDDNALARFPAWPQLGLNIHVSGITRLLYGHHLELHCKCSLLTLFVQRLISYEVFIYPFNVAVVAKLVLHFLGRLVVVYELTLFVTDLNKKMLVH